MKKITLILLTMSITYSLFAQGNDIDLPKAVTTGGKALMDCLNERKTTRTFVDKAMDAQTLSNLLWAANGVNRPKEGKNTAPSARNMQEIMLYVFLEKGVYLYDNKEHKLKEILSGDHRKATGTQDFVKDASVNLVYVADYKKMEGVGDRKESYAYGDAAFICQNVYLFGASEGLGVVVRGSINREEIAKLLNLGKDYFVVFGQSVGYEK